MSRVGNALVQIPEGVTVNKTGNHIVVSGEKGTLEMDLAPEVEMNIEGNEITFKRKSEDKKAKSLHGLTRALVANMVLGVKTGWSKKLELVGVGYRVIPMGAGLSLSVGFSHPVEVSAPEGIKLEVQDNTKIIVSGANKALVGQVAAKIKSIRLPEPYKGKGIRYEGEYIRRKAGKAGKVGAGAPK